jgi:hypothetical protein
MSGDVACFPGMSEIFEISAMSCAAALNTGLSEILEIVVMSSAVAVNTSELLRKLSISSDVALYPCMQGTFEIMAMLSAKALNSGLSVIFEILAMSTVVL